MISAFPIPGFRVDYPPTESEVLDCLAFLRHQGPLSISQAVLRTQIQDQVHYAKCNSQGKSVERKQESQDALEREEGPFQHSA